MNFIGSLILCCQGGHNSVDVPPLSWPYYPDVSDLAAHDFHLGGFIFTQLEVVAHNWLRLSLNNHSFSKPNFRTWKWKFNEPFPNWLCLLLKHHSFSKTNFRTCKWKLNEPRHQFLMHLNNITLQNLFLINWICSFNSHFFLIMEKYAA